MRKAIHMSTEMEDLKGELEAAVEFEFDSLLSERYMKFTWCGRDYIYARYNGKEYLVVPPDEQEAMERLLNCVQQFEERLEQLGVDAELGRTFTRKYFRTRDDALTVAN